MSLAVTHVHLVVRRHVDLGRTRSIDVSTLLSRPSPARHLRTRSRRTPDDRAPHRPAPPLPARAPSGARASGRSATASRSTRTSSPRRTTTRSTCAARILHTYSRRGFDSIDPADLRGRFRWMGLYTQRAPGFDGGKTAMLAEEELDDRFFMMRVRSDGAPARRRGRAGPGQRRRRLRPRHRRRHRPREHPVPLDPHRGRARRSGSASRPPASPPSRRAVTLRARSWAPRVAGVAADEIIDGTRRAGGDQPPLHRRPRVLQPAAQVQDRADRPPLATTSPPRPTTSPSSAPCTPSTAPASTCGSAAGCRPTRCWPRSWACGSRSTRSPTPGPGSLRSSATTATAGCARGPG